MFFSEELFDWIFNLRWTLSEQPSWSTEISEKQKEKKNHCDL